ncbi:circumsporozoite protein, partial [Streptomyces sp. SID161]|uniref:circumsporozoite protein n=3 Tax=Streptomyces TaxID=1883 RepID=UPI00136D237B
AGAMTVQLRSGAAHAGHGVQDRAARAGHLVQDRAARAGHSAQERMTKAGHLMQERGGHGGHTLQDRALQAGHALQDRASHAGHTMEHDTRVPRPVRSAMGAALRHPRPVLIAGAAGAAVIGAAMIWRRIDRGR